MKIKLSELPAFYINMENAIERRHNFLKWNKQLKFKNVKRILGVIGDPYHIGLSRAFQDTIRAGLNSGLPFIAFEDDAAPTEKFKNEIEIPDDADAVYLGVSPWGFRKDQDPKGGADFNGSAFKEVNNFPGIFKIHSTLSGHAILYINKEYALAGLESYKKASKLKNYNDVQIYFDGLFDKYNVYAIGPLFYQNDSSKPDVLEGTKNIDMKGLK
jgi:hypothetical protein